MLQEIIVGIIIALFNGFIQWLCVRYIKDSERPNTVKQPSEEPTQPAKTAPVREPSSTPKTNEKHHKWNKRHKRYTRQN